MLIYTLNYIKLKDHVCNTNCNTKSIVDAVVEDRNIKALRFFTKGGIVEVKAKIYIDATGDGDTERPVPDGSFCSKLITLYSNNNIKC